MCHPAVLHTSLARANQNVSYAAGPCIAHPDCQHIESRDTTSIIITTSNAIYRGIALCCAQSGCPSCKLYTLCTLLN
jgi:hypothetical protein